MKQLFVYVEWRKMYRGHEVKILNDLKFVLKKIKGRITIEDAERTLLRLNSRLGRNYGENDVRAFFDALDANHDETLDLNEFKRAFLSITA